MAPELRAATCGFLPIDAEPCATFCGQTAADEDPAFALVEAYCQGKQHCGRDEGYAPSTPTRCRLDDGTILRTLRFPARNAQTRLHCTHGRHTRHLQEYVKGVARGQRGTPLPIREIVGERRGRPA